MATKNIIKNIFRRAFKLKTLVQRYAQDNGVKVNDEKISQKGEICNSNYIRVKGDRYYLSEKHWESLYATEFMEKSYQLSMINHWDELAIRKYGSLRLLPGKYQLFKAMESFSDLKRGGEKFSSSLISSSLISQKNPNLDGNLLRGVNSDPVLWEGELRVAYSTDPVGFFSGIFESIQEFAIRCTMKPVKPHISTMMMNWKLGTAAVTYLLYRHFSPMMLLVEQANRKVTCMPNIMRAPFEKILIIFLLTDGKVPIMLKFLEESGAIIIFQSAGLAAGGGIPVGKMLLRRSILEILHLGLKYAEETNNILKVHGLTQLTKEQITSHRDRIYYLIAHQDTKAGICLTEHLVFTKILARELSGSGKKLRYIVKLPRRLRINLFINNSYFLPYFIPRKNIPEFDDSIIYEGISKQSIIYRRDIHLRTMSKKFLSSALFKKDSVLPKSENLLTRYCIDRFFLKGLLNLLGDILNKDIDKLSEKADDREKVFNFLNLYGINIKELYNGDNKIVVRKLINYGLNFNEGAEARHMYNSLRREIKKIRNNHLLTAMLNRIDAYRMMLKVTISQAIVYSAVESFLVPSFFDFRGRKYTIGTGLNPQSYKFIRAFIKPYETTRVPFNELCQKSLQVFDNEEVKQDFIADMYKITSKQANKQTRVKPESGESGAAGKGGADGRSADPDRLLTCSPFLEKNVQFHRFRKKLIRRWFYAFLDSNKITYAQFKTVYLDKRKTTFDFWLNFMSTYAKKREQIFSLTSYICLENRNPRNVCYANAYSFDAQCSGYQMQSILFKDAQLGTLCNLTGTEKKDLYQEVANEYNKLIETMFRRMDDILKIGFQVEINTLLLSFKDNNVRVEDLTNYEAIINQLSPRELFVWILRYSYPGVFLKKHPLGLGRKYLQAINGDAYLNEVFSLCFSGGIESWSWLIRWNSNYKNYNKFGSACVGLFCFFEILCYRQVLLDNDWIQSLLIDRQLFKKLVMITIYGASSRTRRQSIHDVLKNHFLNTGLGLTMNVSYRKLKILTTNVDYFFQYFYELKLATAMSLNKIAKILTAQNKPIVIENRDFVIRLAILKFNEKLNRIVIRLNHGKSYKLVIKRPLLLSGGTCSYDLRKMAHGFMPNFTHSMDAAIVADMIRKYNKLQEILFPSGNFTLITNHDNFSIGKTFFPVLPYLLRDSYINLYKYNYLNTIAGNVSPEEFLEIQKFCKNSMSQNLENPYFIKYG